MSAARGLAFFDMDGTLVDGDCGLLFVRDCTLRGLIPPRELAAWVGWLVRAAREGVGEPVVAEAKRQLLRIWLRLGEQAAEAAYDDFFRRVLRPRLRPDTCAEVAHAQREGQVILITANLRTMAIRIGRELGIPPEFCLGAEAVRDANGAITGDIDRPILMGEWRARFVTERAAREQIELHQVRAYGDSLHDLPMLRAVGRPCAVHPGRALRRVAAAEGFRLLG